MWNYDLFIITKSKNVNHDIFIVEKVYLKRKKIDIVKRKKLITCINKAKSIH